MFHGLPESEWLGRMVKVKQKRRNGKAQNPAKIIQFKSNGKVEVRPGNHPRNEIVGRKDIGPWWGKNPDLAAKARANA